MIFNWHTLLAFARRAANTRAARSHITPPIRVAFKASTGPVMRWHINPLGGRLECRLIEPASNAQPNSTMLTGVGMALAVYQRGRALT